MTPGLALALQAEPAVTPFDSGFGAVRAIVALVVVMGLLAGVLWLLRRGGIVQGRGGRQAMAVESALPLGERRSLVIVTVEGRRLLLGLGPGQVALITELQATAAGFAASLDRAVGSGLEGTRS